MVWLSLIDEVSEATREPWSKVWEMSVVEFFNLLTFCRWKAEKRKTDADKWKASHSLKK